MCPVASGETPTEIEPPGQSPVLPGVEGTSTRRGLLQEGPQRAAESDKPGSEDELCPHPYQARGSEPTGPRSVLGTRLTELSWGLSPGIPAPHLPVLLWVHCPCPA